MRTHLSQRFLARFSPFSGPGPHRSLCLGTSLAALAGACTGSDDAPSEPIATSSTTAEPAATPGPAVSLVAYQSNGHLRTDVSVSLDLSQNFAAAEEDGVRYTGSGLPPGLTLLPTGHLIGRVHERVAFTSSLYTIGITATDTYGRSATDSFEVTTHPTNTSPVFLKLLDNPMVLRKLTEPTLSIDLNDYFLEKDINDRLTFSLGGELPIGFRFENSQPNEGLLIGRAVAATEMRSYLLTVGASDGSIHLSQVVTLHIAPENRPPIFSAAPAEVRLKSGDFINLGLNDLFFDPDLFDALSFEVEGLPPGLEQETHSIQGFLAYRVGPAGASFTTTLTATDLAGLKRESLYTLHFEPGRSNQNPVVEKRLADRSYLEGELLSIPVHDLFSDRDGDNWVITAQGLPAELTIDIEHGVITGSVLDDADVGVHPITLVATDDRGGIAHISFTLTIRNVNDAPVLRKPLPVLWVPEGADGAYIRFDDYFEDPDGDELVYSFPSGPLFRRGSQEDGRYQFIANTSGASSLSHEILTVTVSDARGGRMTASLVLALEAHTVRVSGAFDGLTLTYAGPHSDPGAQTHYGVGLAALRSGGGGLDLYVGAAGGGLYRHRSETLVSKLADGDGRTDGGWYLANPGDVDGDGLDDLLVSSRAYAVGAQDAPDAPGDAPGEARFSETISLYLSTRGLKEPGVFVAPAEALLAVSVLGDIDGDGLDDLGFISRTSADSAGATGETGATGAIYIRYGMVEGNTGETGATGNTGEDAPPERLTAEPYTLLCYSSGGLPVTLTGLGDVDGDGLADIAIVLSRGSGDEASGHELLIVYGAALRETRALDLSAFAHSPGSHSPHGYRIQLASSLSENSIGVAGIGDLNGDGLADLLVTTGRVPDGPSGGPSDGPGAYPGAYVVYGRAPLERGGLTLGQETGLSEFSARDGFELWAEAGWSLGPEAIPVGDFNGDGLADFAITSRAWRSDDPERIYLLFGRTDFAESPRLELAQLNRATGLVIEGDATEAGEAGFGFSLASGDWQGDGFDDLFVGTSGQSAGKVYILYGGPQFGEAFLGGPRAAMLDGRGPDHELGVLIGSPEADLLEETPDNRVAVFYGGAGDDTFSLADSDLRRLEGGHGVDSLVLGAGVTLDLTSKRHVVRGVEILSLQDGAEVTLDLTSLYALTTTRNNREGLTQSGEIFIAVQGTGSLFLYAGLPWNDGPWHHAADSSLYRRGRVILQVDTAITVHTPDHLVSPETFPSHRKFHAASDFVYGVGLGDINGDGFDDFLTGSSMAGTAYLVYGASRVFQESDLPPDDLKASFVLNAPAALLFGPEARPLGDVNGDGFQDFVLHTSPKSDATGGSESFYVLYGRDKAIFDSQGLDLEKLKTADGFSVFRERVAPDSLETNKLAELIKLTGADALSGVLDGFPRVPRLSDPFLVPVGDVNGDGLDDMLLNVSGISGASARFATSSGASPTTRTGVFLIFGQKGDEGPLAQFDTRAVHFSSPNERELFGWTLAKAGDFNGDGFGDFAIGSPSRVLGERGHVYLVYGMAQAHDADTSIDVTSDEANVLSIQLRKTNLLMGWYVNSAGDVNGDGFDDLLIGAPVHAQHGWSLSKAYLLYGREERLPLVLDELAPEEGFILEDTSGKSDFTRMVTSSGDINGDGLTDFLIGFSDLSQGGRVYVIYGAERGPSRIDLARLDKTEGFVLTGRAPDVLVGAFVSGALDLNGDGFDDFLTGGTRERGVGFHAFYGGLESGQRPGVERSSEADTRRLHGGPGDDRLVEVHPIEALYGGAGDDVLVLSDAFFRRVDGGGGDDTLVLENYLRLDLTQPETRNRVRHIETVSLYDRAELTLDLATIYRMVEPRSHDNTNDGTDDSTKTTEGQFALRIEGSGTLSLRAGRDQADRFKFFTSFSDDENALFYELERALVRVAPEITVHTEAASIELASGNSAELEVSVFALGQGNVLGLNTGGDVNGDGRADLLVSRENGLYVLFGRDDFSDFSLESFGPGDGFLLDPASVEDDNGGALTGRSRRLGDFDGDGLDDILVGPYAEQSSGHDGAFVVGGLVYGSVSDSRVPDELHLFQVGRAASLRASSLDWVPDSDGDGLSELLIGLTAAEAGASGKVYLVFGRAERATAPLDLSALVEAHEALEFSDSGGGGRRLGETVAGIGDINGDGLGDFMIGAPGSRASDLGSAYILYGHPREAALDKARSTLTDLADLRPRDGFMVQGEKRYPGVGTAFTGLGDINGDGLDDVLLTAGERAYGLFGRAGRARQTLKLEALEPEDGFIIRHETQAGAQAGATGSGGPALEGSSAGDVNGDGFADFLLTVPDAADFGRVFLLFGMPGFSSFAVEDLDSSQGISFYQEATRFALSPSGLSGPGDINQDGFDDFVLGGFSDATGTTQAYLIYGDRTLGHADETRESSRTGRKGILIGDAGDNNFLEEPPTDEPSASDVSVFLGGAGDDVFLLKDALFRRVDGGGGQDTLELDRGVYLDLTATSSLEHTSFRQKIRSIETFSLDTGTVLTLDPRAVFQLTEQRDNGGLLTEPGEVLLEVQGSGHLHLRPGPDGEPWKRVPSGDTTLHRLGAALVRTTEDTVVVHTAPVLPPSVKTLDKLIPGQEGFAGFAWAGSRDNTQLGAWVAGVGDVNGDGLADFLASSFSPMASPGSENARSHVYLMYGRPEFHSELGAIEQLGPTEGRVLDVRLFSSGTPPPGIKDGTAGGTEDGIEGGTTGTGIGDFNGDGQQDFILGVTPEPGSAGNNGGPRFYLFHGETSENTSANAGGLLRPAFVLHEDMATSAETAVSAAPDSVAVTGAGDVNGDGLDDVLLGFSESGSAYVLYGTSRSVPEMRSRSDLHAYDGFVIQGPTTASLFGARVAGGGDINGDGFADLLIAASAGQSDGDLLFVIYGRPERTRAPVETARLDASEGFVIRTHGHIQALEHAGDVNGDGYDDVLVGLRDSDEKTTRALLFYGSQQSMPLDLAAPRQNGKAYFTVETQTPSPGFAEAVAAAGDVNGDGFDDILITQAPSSEGSFPHSRGKLYLVYGSPLPADLSVPDLSVPDGTTDGSSGAFEKQGVLFLASERGVSFRPAAGGDLNGDGFADILAGVPLATRHDLVGGRGVGKVYGFYSTPAVRSVSFTHTPSGLRFEGSILREGDNKIHMTSTAAFVYAGAGDDVITRPDAAFRRIDGGSGNDTLELKSGTLDLTSQSSDITFHGFKKSVRSVETIELAESAELRLDLAALYGLTEQRDNGGAALTSPGEVLLRLRGSGSVSLPAENWTVEERATATLYRHDRALILADKTLEVSFNAVPLPFSGGVLDGSRGYSVRLELSAERLWTSFATGGDFNGDGRSDLLIGSGGHQTLGEAVLLYGRDVPPPATLRLHAVTAPPGVLWLTGGGYTHTPGTPNSQDGFGSRVSGLGDVNGDGLDDLVVGAPSEDTAYVVFGTSQPVALDVRRLKPEQGFGLSTSHVATQPPGLEDGSSLGYSVSPAGDINGDGLGDILVGAPLAGLTKDQAGEVYLIFGTATPRGSLDVSSLAGEDGFVILGGHGLDVRGYGDRLGTALTGAGDVNGDGYEDVILGASRAGGGGLRAGEIYIIYGRQGDSHAFGQTDDVTGRVVLDVGFLKPDEGVVLRGVGGELLTDFSALPADEQSSADDADYTGAGAGWSVAGLGDFNGDGLDDFLLGAPLERRAAGTNSNSESGTLASLAHSVLAGSVYLIYGSASLGTRQAFQRRLYTSWDEQAAEELLFFVEQQEATEPGFSLRRPGHAGQGEGSGFLSFTFSEILDEVTKQTLDLATLSPTEGAVFYAASGTTFDRVGRTVASAGDVNGDGLADLLIASSPGAPSAEASVYLVYGTATPLVSAMPDRPDRPDRPLVNLKELTGDRGSVFTSGSSGSFGEHLAGVGDLNHDGFDDFAIESRPSDPRGTSGDRQTDIHIVYGGATGSLEPVVAVSAAGETALFGGPGPDRLTENPDGAVQVFYGGAGDDQFILTDAHFLRIDGGSGTDHVVVPRGVRLDLVQNRGLQSIERITLSQGSSLILDEWALYLLTNQRDKDSRGEVLLDIRGSGGSVFLAENAFGDSRPDWTHTPDLEDATDSTMDKWHLGNALLIVDEGLYVA